jgi:hypothetical protein
MTVNPFEASQKTYKTWHVISRYIARKMVWKYEVDKGE